MPSSYTLGDHFEAFIREQLRSGRYATASEVIREGLRLLEAALERHEAELAGLRQRTAKRSRRNTVGEQEGRPPKKLAK